MNKPLYERDFYTWALTESDKLRRRQTDLDWENLAEEIEALSRTEARELRSRYAIVLLHLLKWRYQPDKRSRSWEATIRLQRDEIVEHLLENPGLKPRRDELLGGAYRRARLQAYEETMLPEATFPETNPFTEAQAMDPDFWPEPKEPPPLP